MLRNSSMIVVPQISAVCCLVLPEALKNSLASKCHSSHYLGIQKASDVLKVHVNFGVGDETRNRNYLQAWKSCFVRGTSTGISGNCIMYSKWKF